MNHGRRLHLPALPAPGVPDADLLARWVAERDEAAFELLVRRYAPVVLAACRRLLADPNDADDAFQATFLVLARRAASVSRGEVLGAWLHRVACRAALRVRSARARHAGRQDAGPVEQLPAPAVDPALSELLGVLDEEVERLPARHRVAFVLCCLEGRTGEEAGRLLGCPPGTVSSRLTRARERLRDRLARRGFAPALVLAVLTGNALASPTSNALVRSVLVVAPTFALRGGPVTRSAAIAEGVLTAMLVPKFTLVSALFAVGLLAAGVVLAGAGSDHDAPAPARPAAALAADDKGAGPARPPVVRLVTPQAGGADRLATHRVVAEAGRAAHLFPATTGTLRRVEVRIGDRVKEGQVLAEVDAPALVLDERLAAAGVEQARGLLKEAEARVAAAHAEAEAGKGVVRLRQAEAAGAKSGIEIRKRALDRIKVQIKQGAASQGDADEAEGRLRAAEALVDAAMVGVENAKADLVAKEVKSVLAEAGIVTAKANVQIAQVGLERARLAVAQTRITAPFEGVVTEAGAGAGEFVRAPGERADPAPLFTLMRADVLRVVVWVPERDAGRVEVGQSAEATFDALPGVTATGKVVGVGFAVSPQHRTVRAEIDVPNPKGIVRPGMTGSVSVTLGKGPAGAVRVPVRSVLHVAARPGESGTAVYVYKGGKATLTPVRVGVDNGREVEVLSGLTAADQVVADPKGLGGRPEVAVEVEKSAPPK